jgi:uncharacterized membrane protein YeiH
MTPTPIALFFASALPWLDVAGIAVFAASGALAAARLRKDIVTFAFFAAITGTGGGTVRDLLIGAPVFWMHDPQPFAECLVVALLVWLTPRAWWGERGLDWFDAIGLAAYAVYGAAKALVWDIPALPAVGMGVVTACLGGILRDVLAGVPSVLLRPELYVTAAMVGASAYVGLAAIGVPTTIAAVIGSVAGFGLRALAMRYALRLPGYSR